MFLVFLGIVFTFDDGPSAHTADHLKFLDTYKIKAVFCIPSSNINKITFHIIKKISKKHILCNHSYSHPRFDRISCAKQKREIFYSQKLFYKYFKIKPEYFRPPSGIKTKCMIRYLKKLNIKTLMWDYDIGDWDKKTTAFYRYVKLLNIYKKPGVKIVLMHDIDWKTLWALKHFMKKIDKTMRKIVYKNNKITYTYNIGIYNKSKTNMRYFCADHHFSHKNIIKYTNRPFSDIIEMNRILIENHNSLVKKEDEVFFLGDLSMSRDAYSIEKHISQLNGTKHLILGNHDKLKPFEYLDIGFTSVHTSLKLILKNIETILIHDPANAQFKANWVCGHVHGLWYKLTPENASTIINVGVDVNNFSPVPESILINEFK